MANPTIGATTPRIQYTATASQTVFTVPFEFLANADLAVYVNGTLKTLTTDYTLTGANTTGGGTLTFVTGRTAGEIVTILGNLAYSRNTNKYTKFGLLPAEVLEADFDALQVQAKQLARDAQFAVRVSLTDTGTPDMVLPVKATRASKVFGFDSDGNPVASSSTVAAMDSAVTAINTIAGASPGSSASISHIASVTGATATTVQSKLRETVSPADTGSAQATALLLITGPADAHNYCFNPDINQIAGGKANVISGGGYSTSDNEILGATDYQTIGGGYDNTINGCIASTISGGAHHVLSSGVTHGTVGGGSYNDITAGDYGTIAGGTGHTVAASEAAICGGNANTVSGAAGFIGAGNSNNISGGLRGVICGGASNTLNSNDSVIVGGSNNNVTGGLSVAGGGTLTVSGSWSVAFGLSNSITANYCSASGRSNLASKDYGSVRGYQAIARSTGATAAGGRIAADGDSQYTDVPIKGTTTSNTNSYLTGADANQFCVVFPTDNFAATVVAFLTAVEPATGASKSIKVEALVKRIGGTNSLVGGAATITVIAEDAAASAWTVSAFSLSTNNMRIGVSGDVGKTIRWSGKVTAVEVSF